MPNEELFKKLKSLISDGLERQRTRYAKETQAYLKSSKSELSKLAKKADQILKELKHNKSMQEDHERRLRQLEQVQPKYHSNSLSRFL